MAAPATLMFVLSGSGMGGMERMTFELARSLDRARHRPVICCLKCPRDPAPRAGQPEHEGMLRGKYDLGVIPRLRRVMRAERPDVVFALGSGDAAFWGRLAARLSGVRRVAWWLHSMRDDIGRLNLALVPWTDVVIALSPRHRAFLIDRYGLPASKVTVVPNGIDWTAMAESAPRSAVMASSKVPMSSASRGIALSAQSTLASVPTMAFLPTLRLRATVSVKIPYSRSTSSWMSDCARSVRGSCGLASTLWAPANTYVYLTPRSLSKPDWSMCSAYTPMDPTAPVRLSQMRSAELAIA